MTKEIINRVQNSGLITLEMKSFYGDQERTLVDIKNWLYEGLILKENYLENILKITTGVLTKINLLESIAVKILSSLFGHSCWY